MNKHEINVQSTVISDSYSITTNNLFLYLRSSRLNTRNGSDACPCDFH